MVRSMDTPHVAILASPGMGHLTPLLVFAERLVASHHLHVTLFTTTTTESESATPTAQSQLLVSQSLPDRLRLVELPPVDVSSVVPPDSGVETQICIIVRESLPSLRSALSKLSPPPTVLITDIFGSDAFDVADALGMSKYVYCTSTAWLLALLMYLPNLDKEVEGEYVERSEPIRVPGCKPIGAKDVVDPMLNRKSAMYKWILHHATRFPLADGLLVNTCEEVEMATVAALRGEEALVRIPTPPVYPVGPLVRSPEKESLSWLDSQPKGSVLFVSFGSGGTLSAEQTEELAIGLERSGKRFLWVVRPPVGWKESSSAAAAFFSSGQDVNDPSEYLPEGFLERTKDTGLVVPSWAPQVAVLGHPAVVAFLTHGGWNSVSESVIHGVPMIVWPLYAEQRMNAAMLSEELGVAVRVRRKEGQEVVGREVVEEVVRMVMEGEEGKEMKRRVEKMKEVAMKGLEEGGSSYNSLAEVVGLWKQSCH